MKQQLKPREIKYHHDIRLKGWYRKRFLDASGTDTKIGKILCTRDIANLQPRQVREKALGKRLASLVLMVFVVLCWPSFYTHHRSLRSKSNRNQTKQNKCTGPLACVLVMKEQRLIFGVHEVFLFIYVSFMLIFLDCCRKDNKKKYIYICEHHSLLLTSPVLPASRWLLYDWLYTPPCSKITPDLNTFN